MSDDTGHEAFDRRVREALQLVDLASAPAGWNVDSNDALVDRYLNSYTGKWFDALGTEDSRTGNQFTAEDLIAVQMLAVTVPAASAVRLLVGDLADPTRDLLAQIPTDVDLWDAEDSHIGPESAAWALWDLLNTVPGVGWVTANKLIARKRPRLVPVYDSVVGDALQPGPDQFWARLRSCLAEHDDVRVELDRIRERSAADLSHLRVLDIVVWMRAFGHSQTQEADAPQV